MDIVDYVGWDWQPSKFKPPFAVSDQGNYVEITAQHIQAAYQWIVCWVQFKPGTAQEEKDQTVAALLDLVKIRYGQGE